MLQAGCSYLLTPGAKISFGKPVTTLSRQAQLCLLACQVAGLYHVKCPILTMLQSCRSVLGDQAQQYVIDFEEKSGPDPLGDMLMKVN